MNAASLLGSLPLVWLLLLPSLLRALSSQVLIQSSMPVSLQNPADPDGHHQAENDGEEENGVPSDPLQHGLSQLLCDAKPVLPDGLQPRIQPLPYRRGLLLLQRRILKRSRRQQVSAQLGKGLQPVLRSLHCVPCWRRSATAALERRSTPAAASSSCKGK
eukprot:scaffold1449_cov244-Pinguiococcus_pyrenoidosus.AAC.17